MQLTEQQREQFNSYRTLLIEWNKRSNLTAITEPERIETLHFADSLQLATCIDMQQITSIADIGTGAGFPGLALKIAYPHIRLLLIEVNHKKIQFLQEVIKQLGLADVTISDLDWRTFLRTTEYTVDVFVTRAALPPTELIRMFKPACHYRSALLVYWASAQWEPTKKEAAFVDKICCYTLDTKQRKLVIFKKDIKQ